MFILLGLTRCVGWRSGSFYFYYICGMELVLLILITILILKQMATQSELVDKVNGLIAKVQKIAGETSKSLELIETLKSALENQENASPELIAAVEALEQQLNVVDDLVPDEEPEETETPEGEE